MSVAGFDWEEFLELAEALIHRRGDPAAERTGTSRAYYAAFHRAGAYVIARGASLTFTGEDHVLVWDWFLRPEADRRLRRIGDIGHWLRRARRQADDDAGQLPNLSTEAQSTVRLARQIVVELSGPGR